MTMLRTGRHHLRHHLRTLLVALAWIAAPGSAAAGPGEFLDPAARAAQEAQEQERSTPGPGPTREQVMEEMGRPMDIVSSVDAQGRTVEDWTYQDGTWLRFVDGRLQRAGSVDFSPRLQEQTADPRAM